MGRKRERSGKRGKRRRGRGPDARTLFLAKQGIPEAQFRLGDEFGDPAPEEMREITEDLLREAWSGDVDAQSASPSPTTGAWAYPGTTKRPFGGSGRRSNRVTPPDFTTSPPCTTAVKGDSRPIR